MQLFVLFLNELVLGKHLILPSFSPLRILFGADMTGLDPIMDIWMEKLLEKLLQ